ncbi:hypothetical protein TYRP_017074 [Tyrophagus putrescentiae]|nr:hypothetical protein TYRP_017074 [Tyrophagus putrescentiae]
MFPAVSPQLGHLRLVLDWNDPAAEHAALDSRYEEVFGVGETAVAFFSLYNFKKQLGHLTGHQVHWAGEEVGQQRGGIAGKTVPIVNIFGSFQFSLQVTA